MLDTFPSLDESVMETVFSKGNRATNDKKKETVKVQKKIFIQMLTGLFHADFNPVLSLTSKHTSKSLVCLSEPQPGLLLLQTYPTIRSRCLFLDHTSP